MADLERSFGATHEKLSFEKAWEVDPPQEAHGLSLLDYMEGVGTSCSLYFPLATNILRHAAILFSMTIIITSTSLEKTTMPSF